jgi:hypothetical protein
MEDWVISRFPNVIEVLAVKPLGGFDVQVTFSDKTQRVIDLEPYLQGPAFEPIRNDAKMFRRIFIDHGAVAWQNGADIDTDTLYYGDNAPWAAPRRALGATATQRRAVSRRKATPKRQRAKIVAH